MNLQLRRTLITGLFITLFGSVGLAQRADSLVGELINISKAINTSIVAQSLSAKVNSPFIESGPMLTKDGKRLYFSRHGHPQNIGGLGDQDIWFSEFDEASQSWTEAINMGEPLNNAGPNFLCGVGWKGDTVLLGNVYAKKGKMKSGISISIRKGDLWSFPEPVYVSNDYNLSDQVGYDLSHDRNSLIIAEEKADSHGKLDLYVAFRDPNGKHSYSGTESINLGPEINSFGNETSPFLAYDGQTLYFSSDGYNGYGGLDIYMSKRLDRTWTKWSKPENLGPGINTAFDDSYFGFTPDNRFAYYSRGLSPTNADIYRVDMTYLFAPTPGPVEEVKDNANSSNVGQTRVVNHVFNEESKEISKESVTDLESMVKFLKSNKKMNVLIGAHSKKHATRNESMQLSTERANKVLEYLVKNGIERKRLSVHGFGHDVVANIGSMPYSRENPNDDVAASVEFRYVGTAGQDEARDDKKGSN